MAVKAESLSGIRVGIPLVQPQTRPAATPLTREHRLAQARRRRRMASLHSVLESALWIGGSGALLTLGIAGLFGLR